MIFVIAGTHDKARRWAQAQQLADNEWTSTLDLDELRQISNFHVIVLESASELAPSFFEKIFNLALQRGRMNRM